VWELAAQVSYGCNMKTSKTARRRSGSTLVLAATLMALAVVSTGCGSPVKNKLLVAEASGSTSTGVAIWAAKPGDTLDDSNLVIKSAARPAQVATRLEDGATWVNGLGRDWNNTALLSFTSAAGLDPSTGQATSETYNLTTAKPGATPNSLVESSALQATVIGRGVYVRTADGCVLVTAPSKAEDLGSGSCAISSDERWVVSWGANAAGAAGAGALGAANDSPSNASLTIRDLRHKSNTAVQGLGTVIDAVVLSNGAKIMASVQVGDQVQGILLDATNGSQIGRTDKYKALEISPADNGAKGFVFMTNKGEGSALSYMAADAGVQSIDEGFYLVPVGNAQKVTFLSFQQDLAKSTVRSWSPGDAKPESLLTGQVGAGLIDDELLIIKEVDATASAAAEVEFWRPGSGGVLAKVLTIPAAADARPLQQGGSAVIVDRAWVRNHTAYMQISTSSSSSFVRIDMTGDHSDAPVLNKAGLRLDSLDTDGTALITLKDPSSSLESIQVVGPHDKKPIERASFAQTAANLIHEGVIYVTEVVGDTTGASGQAPELSVISFRSTGKLNQKLLWKDRQLAGATWPEQNGATATRFVTVGALFKSQQAAQQAQQGGAAGQAGG